MVSYKALNTAQEDLNSPSIRYVGFNVKLNF